MENNLSGKIALITGATGGIGCAIAHNLYYSGATVILTGRNEEKLCNLHNLLPERSMIIPANLETPKIEQELVAKVISEFGKLDILVNNAGMGTGRLTARTNDAYISQVMQVNFITPYNLCRESLKHMAKNKFGRIINITSISGLFGDAGMSIYAASKAALAAASKSMAVEYAKRGITVNCIAPGIVNTEMSTLLKEEYKTNLKKQIPLGRFGDPAEIAYWVGVLASDKSSYMTGREVQINGGWGR